MITIFLVLTTLIALEFYELNWQKSSTLRGLLLKNYNYYSKNILLFAIRHLSFIYVLFIIFFLNIANSFSYIAIGIKFIDISTKLFICKKIEENGDGYLDQMLNGSDIQLGISLQFLNMIIYTILIALALITVS
jgi:hypothetical protein